MLQCSNRPRALNAPFEDFDRALDGAELAVGEPLEPEREAGAALRLVGELVAAFLGQPQSEPPPVGGILGALDKAGADQAVDRAADRRRSAADRGGDLVERGRLAGGDRAEQLAPRALGPFGGAVLDPIVSDRREAVRQCRRCCSPEHDCSLTTIGRGAILLLQAALTAVAESPNGRNEAV